MRNVPPGMRAMSAVEAVGVVEGRGCMRAPEPTRKHAAAPHVLSRRGGVSLPGSADRHRRLLRAVRCGFRDHGLLLLPRLLQRLVDAEARRLLARWELGER